jgi:hypothetical protein
MLRLVVSLVAGVFLGCTTGGVAPTGVKLERANFRVLKANARGDDYGFRLLGIIPIIQPSWGDAVEKLKEGVDSEGRAVSLANVTQQKRNIYLIAFSIPKVTVQADVVEFLDAKAPHPASRPNAGAASGAPAPRKVAQPASRAPRD